LQVAVVQRKSDLACIDIERNGIVQEIRRDSEHHWALPGGHVNVNENDIDHAAVRELREETGIEVDVKSLVQVGTYGKLGRDPRSGRTVSVAYLAFQPKIANPNAGSDAKQAKIMSVLELLAEPNRLEFDHETMLIDAIQRVRDMVITTPVATNFCAPEFTLSELREVYEVLWHRAYDKEISHRERQKYASEIREYTSDNYFQLLSSMQVYERIAHEMPQLKFELASMSNPALEKISKIVINDARRQAPKNPAIRERLDPANFARKVVGIPDFIEEVPQSEKRSSLTGIGRPAQLYRRGSAERLDPPLRLRVKKDRPKDAR
jgi:ADP-ribose pyrophosphatase YjhB (NUDIX family)